MRTMILVLILAAAAPLVAQQRPPSPDGHASTEIGGHYEGAEPDYVGGRWIDISYGRPIVRGRVDLWGSGPAYGLSLRAGAPVWRAGADISTYLMTQIPLVVNHTRIEPGGYTMFIDLKPDTWTLIISNWQPQRHYDPGNHDQLWGAFGYTPDKDVVRAPMTRATLSYSVDELTWSFIDMSDAGGKMAIAWDRMMASVPFEARLAEPSSGLRP
jgi:Protein of unknown function (DUF2911)